jgi:hypothetical protein
MVYFSMFKDAVSKYVEFLPCLFVISSKLFYLSALFAPLRAARPLKLQMKKLLATLTIVFLLFAACSSVAPWPNQGIFVGYYIKGFEKSDFKPAGTKERWLLSGNIDTLSKIYVGQSSEIPPKATGPVYVAVRGTLSEPGRHGHLGHYSRELVVEQVIEVRELGPNEKVEF